MRLAIMQPYFFPYIGYYQAIQAVDKYILYDNLNFIKDAWINRNRYLSKQGEIKYFNVPLKGKSSFKKIADIEIIENKSWRRKTLNSFYLNYKKTKYFEEVYSLIETVINYPTNKISELNFQSIKTVCNYLDIETIITRNSKDHQYLEKKLESYSLGIEEYSYAKVTELDIKTIRVLEICRMEGAKVFINAIGGLNLYSKETFLSHGLDLKFIKTKNIEYNQFTQNFAPNLSIIDVMMFNSVAEVKLLLTKYELI